MIFLSDNQFNPMNINAQYAQPDSPNNGPLTATGSTNPSSDPAANQNAVMNAPPTFLELGSRRYKRVHVSNAKMGQRGDQVFLQLGTTVYLRTRIRSR